MGFELKDVCITRQSKSVIESLSLNLKRGTVTGIVGPNGSGKSTLLRALYGYLGLHKGSLFLGDRAVQEWEPLELAMQLGVCPQEAESTLDFQVEQVLALRFGGNYDTVVERVSTLAFLRLNDLFGSRLSQLSGGERQRVRLGMALIGRAPWLILDEPANHLDLATGWSLLHYLQQPRPGGVIMALHDLSTAARCCQHLVVLCKGRLVAEGAPGEVLSEDLLEQVFGLRAQLIVDGVHPRLEILGVCLS